MIHKRTIRELRLARGWTQEELATRVGTTRDHLKKIETKQVGPPPTVLERLCIELGCLPEELDIIPQRPPGRPRKPEADLLRRFQQTAPKVPLVGRSSASRLGGLWRDFPGWMGKLNWSPDWTPFLEGVSSESGDETIVQLGELNRGVAMTEVTTDFMGFQQWPVVDDKGRGASFYRRPAMASEDWLLTFQVSVRTSRRIYRLDGLLLVLEPQRTILDLEVDGKGHDPTWDLERATDLAMLAVRIPYYEVFNGPSLTERLRAMGFCQPRRRYFLP